MASAFGCTRSTRSSERTSIGAGSLQWIAVDQVSWHVGALRSLAVHLEDEPRCAPFNQRPTCGRRSSGLADLGSSPLRGGPLGAAAGTAADEVEHFLLDVLDDPRFRWPFGRNISSTATRSIWSVATSTPSPTGSGETTCMPVPPGGTMTASQSVRRGSSGEPGPTRSGRVSSISAELVAPFALRRLLRGEATRYAGPKRKRL